MNKNLNQIAILYHLPEKYRKMNLGYKKKLAFTDQHSRVVARQIKRIFDRNNYQTKIIKLADNYYPGLKNLEADYVFNLVDSKKLEVKITKVLNRLNIPYSGPKTKALRISNNKIKMKRLFQKLNIPAPQCLFLKKSHILRKKDLPGNFPYLVKPAYEHCSLGITEKSIAENYAHLQKIVKLAKKIYKQDLLIEEYIPGTDLYVTLFQKKRKIITLPFAQMIDEGETKRKYLINGYHQKWSSWHKTYKSTSFISPPKGVPLKIREQIRKQAVRAFRAFAFADFARFDIRYNSEQKKWFFLEGNANPSYDTECQDATPASIKNSRLTFDKIITQVVKNALSQKRRKPQIN